MPASRSNRAVVLALAGSHEPTSSRDVDDGTGTRAGSARVVGPGAGSRQPSLGFRVRGHLVVAGGLGVEQSFEFDGRPDHRRARRPGRGRAGQHRERRPGALSTASRPLSAPRAGRPLRPELHGSRRTRRPSEGSRAGSATGSSSSFRRTARPLVSCRSAATSERSRLIAPPRGRSEPSARRRQSILIAACEMRCSSWVVQAASARVETTSVRGS